MLRQQPPAGADPAERGETGAGAPPDGQIVVPADLFEQLARLAESLLAQASALRGACESLERALSGEGMPAPASAGDE
jgi:hypothetical protein